MLQEFQIYFSSVVSLEGCNGCYSTHRFWGRLIFTYWFSSVLQHYPHFMGEWANNVENSTHRFKTLKTPLISANDCPAFVWDQLQSSCDCVLAAQLNKVPESIQDTDCIKGWPAGLPLPWAKLSCGANLSDIWTKCFTVQRLNASGHQMYESFLCSMLG